VGQHPGEGRGVGDVERVPAQVARARQGGRDLGDALERHRAAVGEVVDHDDVPAGAQQFERGVAADVAGASREQDRSCCHPPTVADGGGPAGHRGGAAAYRRCTASTDEEPACPTATMPSPICASTGPPTGCCASPSTGRASTPSTTTCTASWPTCGW